MKIALVGTRGVPAAYSGFETAVENIGARLAERGHDVTVYCRPHMVERRADAYYRGMRLVYLPTVAGKHLDTPVHSLLSTLHLATVRRPDVAIYFIAGNSPFAGLGRLLGVPTAINVDGLDSPRAKWGPWARRYLRLTERAAPRLANVAITDSRVLQDIYRAWGHETVYIPYGSELADDDASDSRPRTSGTHAAGDPLHDLGLEPRRYVLFVGRLVPENNAHVLVEAFAGLQTDLRLAVVGDAPYADAYQERLHAVRRRPRRLRRLPVRGRVQAAAAQRRRSSPCPPRSAARTPSSWRPWPPAPASWSTTTPRTWRRSATPG